jgi:hypothetical protein
MSNGPAFTCTQCRHRDDSAKLYLGVPGLEAEGVCLLGGIPQSVPGAAVCCMQSAVLLQLPLAGENALPAGMASTHATDMPTGSHGRPSCSIG